MFYSPQKSWKGRLDSMAHEEEGLGGLGFTAFEDDSPSS